MPVPEGETITVRVVRPFIGSPAKDVVVAVTMTPRLRRLIARGYLAEVK